VVLGRALGWVAGGALLLAAAGCGTAEEPADEAAAPVATASTTTAPDTTTSTTAAAPTTATPPTTAAPPTTVAGRDAPGEGPRSRGAAADGDEPESTEPPPPTTAAERADPQPLTGRVIAVDPGHNGVNGAHPAEINAPVDAGGFQKACNTTGTATPDGYSEARFNFEVATLLADRLAGLGAEVKLSRTDNDGWGPCIDERGRTGEDADLLVSIHADGAGSTGHGFHVIHPAPLAGYTDQTAGESAAFAAAVRDALVGAGFSPSTYTGSGGLIQRGDLGTLNRSPVPAVIVETGNMQNPADAATLTSPEGQSRLADALTAAVVAHLE
jgi:N-acetylmuramoyl-L-alanine amidase